MSFAPANETASQLWNERSILIGLFLGTIGYGVHLTLFFQCVQALYVRKAGHHNRELLIFVCILFALGNVGNATNIIFGQKTFIDDRDYPGGPNAYFVEQSTDWSAVVCNSVYIVNSWFQDALLLYRFWMIWSRNYYIVAIPALAFLTSMVLSAILIAELSQPGNTFWTTISVNLAIPYWSISISMTIILTALIAGRLLFMRYRLEKLIGPRISTPYVTVAAMLVESAALYSITAIVFLISYGVDSPVQNLALPLLGQAQSIAPLLIILRVAEGQAWSNGTMTQLTSVRFRGAPPGRATNAGSTTVLNTFGSEPRNKTGGSHQDVEQKQDAGESESEFRVAVV
ncbi:hypothetical protein C8F04DRAFT_1093072 [Mycena alexandri]|uniref:Uncharacterized protein n=1 Tax=Mycena alexandri TaxID=1745969 RepID=A0AAD6T0Q6_9AGAR|nr:hypothetical protein C8F04DRAFT_1093058 [Mycena alexandri]KAJ7037260.1 hypothetical protein C8F04DRAFT_1093072 [Mycena alexandri]